MSLADVQALFGVGDEGVLYDFSDEDTLFTDSGRSAAATIGDAVAGVTDLSGNDNHAVQATSSGAPIHRGWPKTVGTDLVTNGQFAADTDWTKGTGWTIASDKATKSAGTASNLTQSISLTAGESYLINILFERSAGSFDVEFQGGTTVPWNVTTISGGHFRVLTALTGNVTLSITADSTFAGDIHEIYIQQVTAWRNLGLDFDQGNNDKLWTAGFDASATDTCTLGIVLRKDLGAGNVFSLKFLPTAATRPQAYIGHLAAMDFRIYGSANDTRANAIGEKGLRYLAVSKVNQSGASQTDELIPRLCGLDKSAEATYAGASLTAANWGSSNRIIVGGPEANNSWLDGSISKVFVINRVLNSTETATLEAWLKEDYIYAGLVGDSTHDRNSSADTGASTHQSAITDLVSSVIHSSMLVADWGDDISEQTTDWATFDAEDKANLDLVVVGGFANDVKQRVGEGTATVATILSDLATFIATIKSDCPDALIYALACTPFKEWSDATTFPAAAYQGWQDYNAGLSGVAGVDAVIDSFNTELDDGSGNLKPEYQAYDDGVHPSTRSRFVVARAIETQIDIDFFTASSGDSAPFYIAVDRRTLKSPPKKFIPEKPIRGSLFK